MVPIDEVYTNRVYYTLTFHFTLRTKIFIPKKNLMLFIWMMGLHNTHDKYIVHRVCFKKNVYIEIAIPEFWCVYINICAYGSVFSDGNQCSDNASQTITEFKTKKNKII